jgi:hypothetical protein
MKVIRKNKKSWQLTNNEKIITDRRRIKTNTLNNLKLKTQNSKLKTVKPFFIISIILIVLSVVKDIRLTDTYTGAALRNRIVSARYMHNGMDPYFSKWKPGMDERFLDPIDSPEYPVNRCTVTPGILLLHVPLCFLSYFYIKYIWLILELAAFGLILFFFIDLASTQREKQLIIIGASFFILATSSWHFHIDRGQVYIFYAFMISLSYWLSHKILKMNQEMSGFILGFSAWLRPPMIFMLLPFIAAKKYRTLGGFAAGLSIGVIISILAGQIPVWESYFKAMTIWTHAQVEGLPMDLTAANIKYPLNGEGVNLMSYGMDYDIDFFSIQGLAMQYLGIALSPGILQITFLGLALALTIYFFVKDSKDYQSIFLIGFLLIMLNEYFLPAPRCSYNYVQWIFPVLLMSGKFDFNDLGLVIIFLLAWLLLCVLNWVPNNLILGEALLWVGTFLFVFRRTTV